MKLNVSKYESDMLQLIKSHTGFEARAAIALLADLKHLEKKHAESGNIQKMSAKTTQRKRGFL